MKHKMLSLILAMTVLAPSLIAGGREALAATQFAKRQKAKSQSNDKRRQEIEKTVRQIVVDELGVTEKELSPHIRFVEDLGADQLDIVELIMRFEEKFEIEIPDDKAAKLKTLDDVYNYVEYRLTLKK